MVNKGREIDRMLVQLGEVDNKFILDLSLHAMNLSFQQFSEAVHMQEFMWRQEGVTEGMCILLAIPNSLFLLIHIFSLLKIGAAPSPVSNELSSSAYECIIRNLEPHVIYSKSDIVRRGFNDYVLLNRDSFYGDYLIYKKHQVETNALYINTIILTTSGTTGYPKSILHNADSLFTNGYCHMEAIEESKNQGTYLSSLSCFFSYGLVAGIFGALLYNKNIVIGERPFYPKQWYDYCSTHNITLSSLTPGMLKKVLDLPLKYPESLKKLTVGGEHTDVKLIRMMKQRFQGDIYLTYGLSEAGPRVFTNKIGCNEHTWDEMGELLPHVEADMDIRTQDGEVEIGELMIKSPTVMKGIVKKSNLEYSDFRDQWLLTGDICSRTKKENRYTFIERDKNIIKINGEIIYPGIIREVICQNDAIEEAKIEMIDELKLGERLIAYITLKNGHCLPDLRKFCSGKLRYLEIPKKFIVVEELEYYKK